MAAANLDVKDFIADGRKMDIIRQKMHRLRRAVLFKAWRIGVNRITILLFIFTLISGCSERKKMSLGGENVIAVIADSSDWVKYRPLLEKVFERKIYTPQTEKLLTLFWSPPSMLNNRLRQKNLLILGTLSKEGKTTKIIKDMLGSNVIAKIRKGEIYVVITDNQFARDQKLMILSAWKEEDLRIKIEENSYFLFSKFNDAANERARTRVLGKRTLSRLSESIMDDHGYTFKIPLDYKVVLDDKENHILWLASHGVRRWFLVQWEEVDDIPVIDVDWILNNRDKLGVSLFDSVRVNRDYVFSERIKIGDWVVLKVRGLYEKIDEHLGGPYVSFAFYDEKTGRRYFIDGAVFSPGDEKLKYLRTLELMAKSFRTKD